MQRYVAALLALCLWFGFPISADALPPAAVVINGRVQQFDPAPVLVDGTLFVPAGGFVEALGGVVEWEAATSTVILSRGDMVLALRVGAPVATVGGTPVSVQPAAQMIGGRPAVPLRFVAEALGARVDWDAETQRVVVATTEPPAAAGRGGVLRDVTAVAAGWSHSLALRSDGSVWAWGDNEDGQIGDGSRVNRRLPVQVGDLKGVRSVAAGFGYSLALLDDGTVQAWGALAWEELQGEALQGEALQGEALAPTLRPAPVAGLSDIVAIAAGRPSMALQRDGTVWLFGGFDRWRRLTAVTALPDVTAVAAGGTRPLLLTKAGTVWTLTDEGVPAQVEGLTEAVAIAAGSRAYFAVRKDGTVWTWPSEAESDPSAGPQRVPGLANVVAVTAESEHALALKRDGTVWAWGRNYGGALGPQAAWEEPAPVMLPRLSGVSAIATGSYHSIALKQGHLVAWGDNERAQLGNGTTDETRQFMLAGAAIALPVRPEQLLTVLRERFGAIRGGGLTIPVSWERTAEGPGQTLHYTAVLDAEAWHTTLRELNRNSSYAVKTWFRQPADLIALAYAPDVDLEVTITFVGAMAVKPDRPLDSAIHVDGSWQIRDTMLKYIRRPGQDPQYDWHHH